MAQFHHDEFPNSKIIVVRFCKLFSMLDHIIYSIYIYKQRAADNLSYDYIPLATVLYRILFYIRK